MPGCKKAPAPGRPFLKNAIDRFESRRQNLKDRQRQLGDRIALLEKLLPRMMDREICCNETLGDEGPLDKVKTMDEEHWSTIDFTDESPEELAKEVERLNNETAELHVGTMPNLLKIVDFFSTIGISLKK